MCGATIERIEKKCEQCGNKVTNFDCTYRMTVNREKRDRKGHTKPTKRIEMMKQCNIRWKLYQVENK